MTDGCIVNTIKAICEMYNEDFKYYKKFRHIDWWEINTWNFEECNCAKPSYIDSIYVLEIYIHGTKIGKV